MASQTSNLGVRTVRLRGPIHPSNPQEIIGLSPKDLDPYMERYYAYMWDYPAPHLEPTCDQISALAHVIKTGFVPYVDLSIFGPFNERFQRGQTFTGMAFGEGGILHKIEKRTSKF